VLPWLVVGAGVVAAGTGTYFFIQGSNDSSKLDSTCGSNCSPSARDAASGKKTTGVILLATGLAAAGGGLVWHFLEPTGPGAGAGRFGVGPMVGGASGLVASGAF
jgi:hypothetical protein